MNEELNDAYIQEVGKQKLLSDAEEQQLAEKIAQGNKRALGKLVAANLSYVISVANQYKNRGLSMDDLVSEGNIGMLKAATHFDGKHGKRFVTYAAPYIREAIEQAIEQQAGLYRVPRNAKDPAWEKKRSHPLSIDAPIGGSNELSLGHVIPDKDATQPDNALEDETATAELLQIIDKLDARSRQVIQRFYGIGAEHRTLAETAQEMGLKRERVRQIRNQAVRKRLPRLQRALDFYRQQQCDMLLILGDILNYGPRNSIPEGIDAKGIVAALNPLADDIVAVRGNCDAEVDQMLLRFPMMSDYVLLVDEGRRILLTHGHVYNPDHLPTGHYDAVFFGHTHLWQLEHNADGMLICNTGSITFPKGGNEPTMAVMDNGHVAIYNLDGKMLKEERI